MTTTHTTADALRAAILADAAIAPEAPDLADDGPQRPGFVHYRYSAGGVVGSLKLTNTRARLLEFADVVRRKAELYGGRPKRCGPSGKLTTPRGNAFEALHGAWKAATTDGERADALQACDALGGVFFGAGGDAPIPYTALQRLDVGGHSFIIGRGLQHRAWYVLHERCALSVQQREKFSSARAARSWLEERCTDAAWLDKVNTAAAKTDAYCQAAALRALTGQDPDAQHAPATVAAPAIAAPAIIPPAIIPPEEFDARAELAQTIGAAAWAPVPLARASRGGLSACEEAPRLPLRPPARPIAPRLPHALRAHAPRLSLRPAAASRARIRARTNVQARGARFALATGPPARRTRTPPVPARPDPA